MANTPNFTNTPRLGITNISIANPNRDGSGQLYQLFSAGSSGSRIEHIDISAVTSSIPGVIRLYLTTPVVTNYLWKEVVVTSNTPTTASATFKQTLDFSSPSNVLVLSSGSSISVSTQTTGSFNVFAFGGDF